MPDLEAPAAGAPAPHVRVSPRHGLTAVGSSQDVRNDRLAADRDRDIAPHPDALDFLLVGPITDLAFSDEVQNRGAFVDPTQRMRDEEIVTE